MKTNLNVIVVIGSGNWSGNCAQGWIRSGDCFSIGAPLTGAHS